MVPLSFSLPRSNGGTKKSNRTYRARATARGLRLSVLVLGDELSTKVSLALSHNHRFSEVRARTSLIMRTGWRTLLLSLHARLISKHLIWIQLFISILGGADISVFVPFLALSSGQRWGVQIECMVCIYRDSDVLISDFSTALLYLWYGAQSWLRREGEVWRSCCLANRIYSLISPGQLFRWNARDIIKLYTCDEM